MIPWRIERTIDLTLWQRGTERLGALMYTGSSKGHRLELRMLDSGQAAQIDGDARAYFMHYTNGKAESMVPVAGTVQGNQILVEFPAEAYQTGQNVVIVRTEKQGVSVPVYAGSYHVQDGEAEVVIDPEDIVPNLSEILTQISAVRAATADAVNATNTANRNEQARATAEKQRVQNENARVTAENSRATAESQRAQSESGRVTAEKNRIVAENKRVQNESARAIAEQERTASEDHRIQAEKERDSAEQIRVNAEKNRLETDKKLSENEENRAHSFEQYDGDICQLKKELKNVSAHQNVLIGNESGNPISTSDAFAAPLCGLHIYGRSRQDGTPSADNTVEIVGAGADGTLQVKITGANLLDFEKAASENANAEFTFENGILTVKALNKQGWAGIFIPLPDECAGKQIFFRRTIDSNPNGLKSLIQMRYSLNGKATYFSSTSILKIPEGASDIRYNVMARNENTAAEGTIKIQYPIVCYGDKLLPYEPYHEQAITVQTSSGLHGIPVSSGGNYTDADGQQWVCDELDFAQGKLIRRVNVEALDATKTLSEQSNFEMEPVEFPLSSEEVEAYEALTAYAQTTVVQAKNVAGVRLDYQRDVNLVIQSLENAIASMTTSN